MLCGAASFNSGDRQLLTILLEPIKHDLGVSDTAMGLLTGMGFAACYFIAGIPLAVWADRGVRRDVVACCLAVWSVMTALCGFAQNFLQMAATRAGVAIGEAGGNPASHSLVMDFYPPAKRATALAALIGSQAFGIALGLALGGWLSVIFNWRMVFILASIPGLAWALLLRLTVREPARGASDIMQEAPAKTPLLKSLAELWRFKSIRVLLAMAGVGSFNGFAILGWSPTFFMRVHNMRADQLGYKIGLASATGLILGNLLAGWLSDKLGTKDVRWYMRVAGFASFLAMPFVLLFLFAPNPYLALVGLACTQLLLTAFMPPLFTMALTLSPTRLRATTSMLMGLALYVVGLGFGPLVIGMLNDALASVYGTHAVRFSLLVELISLATCGALALLANRWLVRELEEATAIRLSGAKAAVDGAAR